MHLLPPVLLALALAGCASAPTIEHIVVDDSSAGVRARVRVLQAQDLRFTRIQGVTSLSCRQMAWDSSPSEADATAQLQIKAARLGADALTNLRCEPPRATTLRPNCWESMVCHADAVRLE